MPAGRQWFGPVLDLQVSEAREVSGVGGNEYKSIGVSDRGNLTIHVRQRVGRDPPVVLAHGHARWRQRRRTEES